MALRIFYFRLRKIWTQTINQILSSTISLFIFSIIFSTSMISISSVFSLSFLIFISCSCTRCEISRKKAFYLYLNGFHLLLKKKYFIYFKKKIFHLFWKKNYFIYFKKKNISFTLKKKCFIYFKTLKTVHLSHL
jgi:hypothetical protein